MTYYKKMNILAICQYGFPEPYPSLLPMEEMVSRGHCVSAVTGMPNYPMGDIYTGYSHSRIVYEAYNGVNIAHVPLIPRKKNLLCRILNYHSFPISASGFIRKLDGRYDIVFANQTSPVMMVEPAIKYAKKWNKKVVMYCMDLWPASIIAGGIREGSLIYSIYNRISKHIYQNVDLILITSKMFKNYFINNFSIPEEKIYYLPQYADSVFDKVMALPKKTTTDLVFAGNVGTGQNLSVILRAAKIIQKKHITDNNKKIVFHIIGDGQMLGALQDDARRLELNNVEFHGRKPQSEMPKYYANADAMIVTLINNPYTSMTLPAKVQGYLASGRPILASANGEIARVIKESNAGFCSPADDEKLFVDNIERFLKSDRKELGDNARRYYDKNFSKEVIMDELEEILLKFAD